MSPSRRRAPKRCLATRPSRSTRRIRARPRCAGSSSNSRSSIDIIPILEDDYVVLGVEHGGDENDPKAKFSSGFLKVTPAHDPNDYDVLGQKYNLANINVMAPDASISLDHGWSALEPAQKENAALKPFSGLAREPARESIVAWFKTNGLLEKIVPVSSQPSVTATAATSAIEPYLSDQWYCKVTDPTASPARRTRRSRQNNAPLRHPQPTRLPLPVAWASRPSLPLQNRRMGETPMLRRTTFASSPSATPRPTKPGTTTSATGASAGSCGGDIGFRCGRKKGFPNGYWEKTSSARMRSRQELSRTELNPNVEHCRRRRKLLLTAPSCVNIYLCSNPIFVGSKRTRKGLGSRGFHSRPRRPRHLVQQRALAHEHPRLAWRIREQARGYTRRVFLSTPHSQLRADLLEPNQRPLHRARDHHALGLADGDVQQLSPAAICRSRTSSFTR